MTKTGVQLMGCGCFLIILGLCLPFVIAVGVVMTASQQPTEQVEEVDE